MDGSVKMIKVNNDIVRVSLFIMIRKYGIV